MAGWPKSRTKYTDDYNALIYGLLDFTGVLQVRIQLYRLFAGLFLGVLPTATDYVLPSPVRWLYSIVLTIVHFDGTSIASLHNTITMASAYVRL